MYSTVKPLVLFTQIRVEDSFGLKGEVTAQEDREYSGLLRNMWHKNAFKLKAKARIQ